MNPLSNPLHNSNPNHITTNTGTGTGNDSQRTPATTPTITTTKALSEAEVQQATKAINHTLDQVSKWSGWDIAGSIFTFGFGYFAVKWMMRIHKQNLEILQEAINDLGKQPSGQAINHMLDKSLGSIREGSRIATDRTQEEREKLGFNINDSSIKPVANIKLVAQTNATYNENIYKQILCLLSAETKANLKAEAETVKKTTSKEHGDHLLKKFRNKQKEIGDSLVNMRDYIRKKEKNTQYPPNVVVTSRYYNQVAREENEHFKKRQEFLKMILDS